MDKNFEGVSAVRVDELIIRYEGVPEDIQRLETALRNTEVSERFRKDHRYGQIVRTAPGTLEVRGIDLSTGRCLRLFLGERLFPTIVEKRWKESPHRSPLPEDVKLQVWMLAADGRPWAEIGRKFNRSAGWAQSQIEWIRRRLRRYAWKYRQERPDASDVLEFLEEQFGISEL